MELRSRFAEPLSPQCSGPISVRAHAIEAKFNANSRVTGYAVSRGASVIKRPRHSTEASNAVPDDEIPHRSIRANGESNPA
jgi:hypothetical protein